jgi:hypothetical protein
MIYTFRLKGKKLPSLHFYFGILCWKGKVFDKDQNILLLTMQRFNQLYGGPQAIITSRMTRKGEPSYTLQTHDGQGVPDSEFKRMIQEIPKP